MCSLLLKECTFAFLFAFTAAGVVQCGGSKTSPRTSTIVEFIFHFCPFCSYLKFTKLQHVFLWLSLQSHNRVTDEAFLAETSNYGPSTFLRMRSPLLKERTFVLLFPFTAAGVVQCGGRKRLSVHQP